MKAWTSVIVASGGIRDCLTDLSWSSWKKQDRLSAATWSIMVSWPSSRIPRSLSILTNWTAFVKITDKNLILFSCPASWSRSALHRALPLSYGSTWYTRLWTWSHPDSLRPVSCVSSSFEWGANPHSATYTVSQKKRAHFFIFWITPSKMYRF